MGALPDGLPAPISGEIPAQHLTASDKTFHAYLHIPFCSERCGYCDFNTYTNSELRGFSRSEYSNSLLAEIDLAYQILGESDAVKPVETVFFGGGTPTLLPADQLISMLADLRETFGVASSAEITVEANPDTASAEYFAALAEAGFTRVSIGMQSAVKSVLATLERTHQPENVSLAVKFAKAAGLETSVDLIYGAPGETLEQWNESLEAAVSLEVGHISAYALIVEEGTKLARQIRRGELVEPDADLQADKYELLDAKLAAAGFSWYELSNWATGDATKSRHNMAYWQSANWWGFGPGAHSHLNGLRWWNVKHPAAYAERLDKNQSPALARESLSERDQQVEAILLKTRLASGVSIPEIAKLNPEPQKVISQLIADGLIDAAAAISGRVVLTLRGRLLADYVVRELTA